MGHEPPPGMVSEALSLATVVECVCRLVGGVSDLCGITPQNGDEPLVMSTNPRCDVQVMLQNVEVTRSILDRTWNYFLASLQTLMVTLTSPPLLSLVLSSYASFTHTCGALQLLGPRDKALAPLCRSALPGNPSDGTPVALKPYNILISKVLLRLVFELGSVLAEAWMLV
eukprot:CAMPEP_0173463932 /NCGR_PEP_ID=MMETSP1357-20121228/69105_1 /TAXON_ID=77926 /ORGANISM="Hemiselmis rufescens, Strain PCC563" /LENGTH=169 /DNA_ID=CAMNT_0014431781 /DNA_START=1 /DNA_END=507 /DNA_ORIENTATION=-